MSKKVTKPMASKEPMRKSMELPKGASLTQIITQGVYSREGAEAFHKGNPFAIAFNKALNRG